MKPEKKDIGSDKKDMRHREKGAGSDKKDMRHREKGIGSDKKAIKAENEKSTENIDMIFGRNPVAEALKGERPIDKILVAKDTEGSIVKILEAAREKGVQVRMTDRTALDRICRTKSHQGVMAYAAPVAYSSLEDIIEQAEAKQEDLFLLLLDGIEDPHNLGAIIRSADAVGAHGVVIPARRAAGLSETVAKASAGAVEHVPVAKVANIAQTIDKLKKMGVWVGAADMDGQQYWEADLSGKIALVIGGEGSGVGKLVKEKCDFTLRIPMRGKVGSLNASSAAAVLMYEVRRQRQG